MTVEPDWKERKDVNTRALVDTLKKHFDARLATFEDDLDRRTKGFVTKAELAAGIVGLLALIATLVFTLQAPVKESAASTRQEMREARKDLATEVKELKQEVSAKVEKIDARVEGMWRVQIEGQPKGAVREELKRRTTEGR